MEHVQAVEMGDETKRLALDLIDLYGQLRLWLKRDGYYNVD